MAGCFARSGAAAAFVGVCLTTAPARAEALASPPQASLASILDECGTMTLAASGRHLEDKSAAIGHLEISFADGTMADVLGKSGSVLGFYFEGRGHYRYSTDDEADRKALALNATRASSMLRAPSGELGDDFKKALVLFGRPGFAEPLSGEAEPSSASMNAAFKTILAAGLTPYDEFDFRTALTRLNERGYWVYAEFGGGAERVGYAYDDIMEGIERLFTFRKLIDYNVRFAQTLSYQEVPGWDKMRRQSVVLTHADISVATNDNKSGTIRSDLTFHVREAGTRLLSLQLLNNRDPDSADWKSPLHKLITKSVSDADGKPLSYSHKYGEIVVEIPPTPGPDSDVKVHFETEGDVLVDLSGQHTDNYFALEGTDWYPTPPSWAGQRFTYTLKVKVKKPWRPVTSGRELSLTDDGQFVTAEANSDTPSMQVAVMAGKYFTHAEVVDGITVRVHSYAWNRKAVLGNMPKLAIAFMKFYSGLLEPLPANELDIVEVPAFKFGISPAGMVLITTDAYANVHDESVSGVNARLAHEIAHQWFGHKAVPLESSDNWLAESFAEYFAGIAMASLGAKEKTAYGFDAMLVDWRSGAKNCEEGGTLVTANYLGGETGVRDRACLLFSRGPLILHMLRTSIGNDRFFAATKKFLDRADAGPVTTNDFAKAVSDVVQTDMDWFFDQWVRDSGNAEVTVEQHVDPAANGQYRLWGVLRQLPGVRFKQLVVPLVWESAGKKEARAILADQPETKFEFMLPAKPGKIKPDPFQNNLAVYK